MAALTVGAVAVPPCLQLAFELMYCDLTLADDGRHAAAAFADLADSHAAPLQAGLEALSALLIGGGGGGAAAVGKNVSKAERRALRHLVHAYALYTKARDFRARPELLAQPSTDRTLCLQGLARAHDPAVRRVGERVAALLGIDAAAASLGGAFGPGLSQAVDGAAPLGLKA